MAELVEAGGRDDAGRGPFVREGGGKGGERGKERRVRIAESGNGGFCKVEKGGAGAVVDGLPVLKRRLDCFVEEDGIGFGSSGLEGVKEGGPPWRCGFVEEPKLGVGAVAGVGPESEPVKEEESHREQNETSSTAFGVR